MTIPDFPNCGDEIRCLLFGEALFKYYDNHVALKKWPPEGPPPPHYPINPIIVYGWFGRWCPVPNHGKFLGLLPADNPRHTSTWRNYCSLEFKDFASSSKFTFMFIMMNKGCM